MICLLREVENNAESILHLQAADQTLCLVCMLDIVREFFEIFLKSLILLLVIDQCLLTLLLLPLVPIFCLCALSEDILFITSPIYIKRAVTILILLKGFLEDIPLGHLALACGFAVLAIGGS